MLLNNTINHPSNDGNTQTVITAKPDGNLTAGLKRESCTSNTLYSGLSPKHKTLEPRASKGSNGFPDDARKCTKNAIVTLAKNTSDIEKLCWTTLTFQHLCVKQLIKIAINIDKIRDYIRDFLNKIGYYYVVVIGIQNDTSYNYKILCYDINIISLPKYVTDDVIARLYKGISRIINGCVKPPSELWHKTINNDYSDLHQFLNYFVDNQVKNKAIPLFRQTG